jgi:multidrug resistance efflux pump
MSWILGGLYCGAIWLVFAKWKLMRLSLPIAIVAASVGPALIVAFLFCAQYFHPYTSNAVVFQQTIPIIPQLGQSGRVTDVAVKPNTLIQQGDVLFRVDSTSYELSVRRLAAALDEAVQAENVAEASIIVAKAELARATSDFEFATVTRDRNAGLIKTESISQQEYDASVTRFKETEAAVSQATASLTQSQLSVQTAKARIAQVQAQLADARYDLAQTTVLAPDNGFVTNLQLRPGMLVGGPGSVAVMTYVIERQQNNTGVVVALFGQKNYLRIKQGQYAEVALNGYPGEIFTGRVENTIDVSGAGQLTASGVLPTDLASGPPTEFAVRVKLDDSEELRLPGGSRAQVAVYTEDVQIAGIPVMFVIRAQSWLRYLLS